MGRKQPVRSKKRGVKQVQPSPQPQPTGPLQDRLAIEEVRLLESQAKLNISGGIKPSGVSTKIEVSIGFGGDKDQTKLLGNLRVTLEPPEGQDKADMSWVRIQVVFQCVFVVAVGESPKPGKLSDSEVGAIQNMISVVVWPFVRHHVASITQSMGITTLTLPLVRVRFTAESAPPVAMPD